MVKVKLNKGEHNVSGPEGVEHYVAGDTFEISEQSAAFLKDRIEIISTEVKRGPGRPKKVVEPVVPAFPKEPLVETVDSVLDETSVEPLSVGDLDLDAVVIAILKDAGLFTVEQLAEQTEASLVKISGIGRTRAELILNAVKAVQD